MTRTTRPFALYLVTLCLLFLALNALPVGLMMVTDSSGAALGMTTDWLAQSPFPNYLVPGLFLFTVIGLGSVALLVALWLRPKADGLSELVRATHEHWAWALTVAFGGLLIAWIVIQALMLRMFHPMQIAIAAIGLVIAGIAFLPSMRQYLKA
jgi:hypothetical protein